MENIKVVIQLGTTSLSIEGPSEYVEEIVSQKELKVLAKQLINVQERGGGGNGGSSGGGLQTVKGQVSVAEPLFPSIDSSSPNLTLAEFLMPLLDKGLVKKNSEKIAVIGYYLENFAEKSEFNIKDLKEGFRFIREAPKNLHRDVEKSMIGRTPYLTHGVQKRHYRLTRTAIDLVKSKLTK